MIRLSVSNLAWPAEQEDAAFKRLAALGVTGVEVAPTRLAPWPDLTEARLTDYRHRIEASGLSVSSLQAILFGRGDVHLLGDAAAFERLCGHLRQVAAIASTLGAGVLVFGSPRNRLRGEMAADEAWNLARRRFAVLGEICAASGVVLGIEPVPAFYGGDFLTSWTDVLRMVREVKNPGVRVHLDTGCVHLGGDDIAEAIAASEPVLAHFHAAQPDLGDFTDPLANHTKASQALRDAGYDRWIAIEMREQSGDPMHAIEIAIGTVTSIYGIQDPSAGAPGRSGRRDM